MSLSKLQWYAKVGRKLEVKKVNWVQTLFNASRGAHLLFTSDWDRLLDYNVAVRGLAVLGTTSLLPSQPELVLKYTWVQRSKVK